MRSISLCFIMIIMDQRNLPHFKCLKIVLGKIILQVNYSAAEITSGLRFSYSEIAFVVLDGYYFELIIISLT